MKLTRPLAFLDIESTGTDPQADRILELAILIYDGATVTANSCRRFNPGFAIPTESTAIHGITDADVANEPPFSSGIGRSILKRIEGCDLAGYNLRRFDLPILDEELRRVGLKLNLFGVGVIDAYGIFSKKEPRSLSDAVRKYCGREHEGAHGAAADTQASLDVLLGQLKTYPDLEAMETAKLAEFSRIGDFEFIDIAGKLYRDKDGDACYAFGKNRGVKVRDDAGYADWMLNRAKFPGSTNEALQAELDRIYREDVA
jgi:DNA polymerase-3 subunit epsilon